MIPVWLLPLVKNKWFWYGVAGVALAAVSIWQLDEFGDRRYKEGQAAERIVWQTIVTQAVEARDEANRRNRRLQAQLDVQSETIRAERREDLRETQEEIRNAETVEEQFAIYRAHRQRLRDEADASLARARADYLSTVGDGDTGSSAGIGPEPTAGTEP